MIGGCMTRTEPRPTCGCFPTHRRPDLRNTKRHLNQGKPQQQKARAMGNRIKLPRCKQQPRQRVIQTHPATRMHQPPERPHDHHTAQQVGHQHPGSVQGRHRPLQSQGAGQCCEPLEHQRHRPGCHETRRDYQVVERAGPDDVQIVLYADHDYPSQFGPTG
jgi:hypothetical protein